MSNDTVDNGLCQGVVAFLDVLGVSSMNLDETRVFKEKFKETFDAIYSNLEASRKLGVEPELGFWLLPKPIIAFGDTVVCYWKSDGRAEEELCEKASNFLSIVLTFFLDNSIPLRGAFGMGEFFEEKLQGDHTTLFGPVVNEVASCYEVANWIGIMAVPDTRKRIFHFDREKYSNRIDHFFPFIEYEIPLSKGGFTTSFAVNWPKHFKYQLHMENQRNDTDIKTEEKFMKTITGLRWFGGNDKYSNTMKFFSAALNDD